MNYKLLAKMVIESRHILGTDSTKETPLLVNPEGNRLLNTVVITQLKLIARMAGVNIYDHEDNFNLLHRMITDKSYMNFEDREREVFNLQKHWNNLIPELDSLESRVLALMHPAVPFID